MKQNSAI